MTSVDRTQLPSVGSNPPFSLPHFVKVSLSNNTKVWTAEYRRAPMVTLRLLLPVGAAADPLDKFGLAALTADLLDEGSAGRSSEELHKALMRIGGHLKTEVWSDATVIGLTTLSRHLQEGLRLLYEVVMQPRFHLTDINRVRAVRLQRIRQMKHTPAAVADRLFLKELYGSHPYGHLSIGTEEGLQNIGESDVLSFHKGWYRPSCLTLIAVGNLNPADIIDAVIPVWSTTIESDRDSVSVPKLPIPTETKKSMFFVSRDDAVQSELRLGHLGVSRSSPDYYALRVLNMVLGGQFVSRLNLNLREDKGYTYGASTSFDWRLGRGPFSLQVSVQTESTCDAICESVKEIADIRGERAPSVRELDLARAALTKSFPRNFETVFQIAHAAVQIALHDLNEDVFSHFVPRVLSVSPEDVSRVATEHLQPDRLLAVVVGSRSAVFSRLGDLDFGDPVEVSA
tara:strand:- start:13458 stop:14822 length:1365 start_codon:yes stop_codon:yes gene_type:complete